MLVDVGSRPGGTGPSRASEGHSLQSVAGFSPEDTIRFYALRLHEVGMVKASPQKILAQGTDWRFLNELKKELKA